MRLLSIMQSSGRVTAFILYVIADFICIGAGMGVPVFCILLGLPVGWYAVRRSILRGDTAIASLRHVLSVALATTSVTFAAMLLIWGRCLPLVFDKTYDFPNFGHPMILYDPWYSFIAWLALMILISPVLQVLVTMFAAHITLLAVSRSRVDTHEEIL